MYVSPVVWDCSVVPKAKLQARSVGGMCYTVILWMGLLEAMAFHLFLIVPLHIDPKEP